MRASTFDVFRRIDRSLEDQELRKLDRMNAGHFRAAGERSTRSDLAERT